MNTKVRSMEGKGVKTQKRFKFHRKDDTITFYWGGMVQIIKVPGTKVQLSHKKGSVTITDHNAEGYVYDPVFVNGSKEKVEF